MRKVLFLLSFLPSLTFAGFKTDYMVVTGTEPHINVTEPLGISTATLNLNSGFVGFTPSAVFFLPPSLRFGYSDGSDTGAYLDPENLYFSSIFFGGIHNLNALNFKDGTAQTTGFALPSGGTDGQCLVKDSNSTGGWKWADCGSGPTPPSSTNFARLEDNTYFLLEDGSSKLLLEK